jgi:hypothetical protein
MRAHVRQRRHHGFALRCVCARMSAVAAITASLLYFA